MTEGRDPFEIALADALTGAYKAKRFTQESFAARVGMSKWTLQKKFKGRTVITATDLVLFAKALGSTPNKLVAEAENLLAQKLAEEVHEPGVSEAPISLAAYRKKPSEMTVEELEQLRGAAIRDTYLDTDESELP